MQCGSDSHNGEPAACAPRGVGHLAAIGTAQHPFDLEDDGRPAAIFAALHGRCRLSGTGAEARQRDTEAGGGTINHKAKLTKINGLLYIL